MIARAPHETRIRAWLHPSVELHHLMRWWRHRLSPAEILGPAGLCRRVLTQETMAELTGVSPPWYGRLERGDREPNYSDEFLDKVAAVLRLSDDERSALYLLLGRQPSTMNDREHTMNAAALQRIVDTHGGPAYVANRSWDLLVSNDPMTRWFPRLKPHNNIMRWVFFDPHSREQLVGWERYWAPRMLALMRGAHARWPDHKPLKDLITETLMENEYARQLWETRPEICMHPDGARCRIKLPHRDAVQRFEVVACALQRADDLQLVMLLPLGHPAS